MAVAKRKINVEKLSDEQLSNAQQKISEKIAFEVDTLVNKWNTELKPFDRACKVHVVVNDGLIEEKAEKAESNLNEFHVNPQLGSMAKELDRVAYGMEQDLNSAVTSCNTLLNRYGMHCDMGFVSEVISK